MKYWNMVVLVLSLLNAWELLLYVILAIHRLCQCDINAKDGQRAQHPLSSVCSALQIDQKDLEVEEANLILINSTNKLENTPCY